MDAPLVHVVTGIFDNYGYPDCAVIGVYADAAAADAAARGAPGRYTEVTVHTVPMGGRDAL